MGIDGLGFVYPDIGTTQVLINDTLVGTVLVNQVEAAIGGLCQDYGLLQLS